MSALNTLLRWLAMAGLLFLEQTETPWLKVGCFILFHPSYKQISVLKKENHTTASKQILQRAAGLRAGGVSGLCCCKTRTQNFDGALLSEKLQAVAATKRTIGCASCSNDSWPVQSRFENDVPCVFAGFVILQVLLFFVWLPTEYPRGGSLPWQAPSLDMIAWSQVSSAVSWPAAVIVEVWIYIQLAPATLGYSTHHRLVSYYSGFQITWFEPSG